MLILSFINIHDLVDLNNHWMVRIQSCPYGHLY
jgi:hypothetical protein